MFRQEENGRAEGQDTELTSTGPDSALGTRVPTSKKPAWEIDGFFSTVAYCDWQQDAWVAQLHLQLGEQCLCLPTPEGHKEVPTCGNCKLAAWDTQCSHEERVRVNARVWGSSLARADRKAGERAWSYPDPTILLFWPLPNPSSMTWANVLTQKTGIYNI